MAAPGWGGGSRVGERRCDASVLVGDGQLLRALSQTVGAWHEDQGTSTSGGRHGGLAGGASDTWSRSGAPTATRGLGRCGIEPRSRQPTPPAAHGPREPGASFPRFRSRPAARPRARGESTAPPGLAPGPLQPPDRASAGCRRGVIQPSATIPASESSGSQRSRSNAGPMGVGSGQASAWSTMGSGRLFRPVSPRHRFHNVI